MKNFIKLISVLLLSISFLLSGQAQNIIDLEYFIDHPDPGFGLASSVAITPGTDISNNGFNVDIIGLNPGLHTLYVRSKDENGNWSLAHSVNFLTIPSTPRDIVQLEYFIDNNDPGIGQATAVAIPPEIDVVNKNFNINLSGLAPGVHTLHLRSKEENGIWSLSHPFNFLTLPSLPGDIAGLEYFIDNNDPGMGQATSVTISPGVDVMNKSFNIDLSGFAPGLHTLHLRSKEENGIWSLSHPFNFLTIPSLPGDIVGLEYFIDNNDPGFGQATTVTVSSGIDVVNKNFNIGLSGLTPGLHTLYLRSKEENGKWSLTHPFNFLTIPSLPGDIVGLEYFIDNNDPGFGQATTVVVSPEIDVVNKNFNINLSGLTPGLHTLYFRSKEENGKWSLSHSFNFLTTPLLPDDIVGLEYFIDNNDPGFGLANAVVVTAGTNIANENININLSALAPGIHTVHFRSQNSKGEWSMSNTLHFITTPPAIDNVVAMEYFIDNNDPGFGQATNIPFGAETNISNLPFNVDLSALSFGIHTLYIRSKNSNGKWTVTSKMHFIRNDEILSNINQFEYFIDNDPGFGNATAINPIANTDINNFIINVDISAVTPNTHKFFIRSLETGHTWSLTNQLTFMRAPLPVELLNFNAKLVGREVALDWNTAGEIENNHFEVEHSVDGIQYSKLDDIAGAGNTSSVQNYFFLHKNPEIRLNYYRLKQVDFDGSFEYSEVKVVNLPAFINNLIIYPVPATNKIIAASNQINEGEYAYEIFDANGRLVKVILGISLGAALSNEIDISDLADGYYILRLKAKKQLYVQSFVKTMD